jgi:hypothetical protein
MAMPDYVLDDLLKTLRMSFEAKVEYHSHNINALRKEYDRLQKRLDAMYEDKLDGRITTDEYDKLAKKYKQKQEDLNLQLEDHTEADKNYFLASSVVLALAKNAYFIFKSSEPKEKRQLLSLILQNCQLSGKKLKFSLKQPYDKILQCSKSQDWLPTPV